MKDSYLKIGAEFIYYRHNDIKSKRKSLLFVHGLGDSGLSFEDVFSDKRFDKFNLIVPDLAGYGRSSSPENRSRFGYDTHLERLWRIIKKHKLDNLILIGHSMGGDLTTLLCASDKKGVIKKYINIEGDITQHDLTISSAAVRAHNRKQFDTWFEEGLKRKIALGSLGHLRSGRLYFASLSFCRKDVFLANALELVKRNTSKTGNNKSEIGPIYCNLSVPRVFCYGTESLSKESLEYLTANKMKVQAFKGVGHCPMTDASEEFYSFLYDYVLS